MGDDHSRSAALEAVERLLNGRLVLAVHAGQCLVQDQDRRVLELGLARIGIADTKVVGDRAMEQIRVLGDDGNLAADHLEWLLAEITPAEQDSPSIRVKESQQQPDQRRL